MSHRSLTHSERQLKGRILAWTPWSRLHALVIRRGNLLGRTGANGARVLAHRLVMILFALVWLPVGIYASYSYLGVHYVPPVFFDEMDRSGHEVAAQGGIKFNGRMANRSQKFEWQLVPGVIAEVISLNARCADLTIFGQANPNESAQRGLLELPASLAPSGGRSVLTVSYIGAGQTPGKYVTTAWNAGRHATRSTGEAMPILERLAVTPNENRDEHAAIPCTDIARQPARHGVHAEAARTMDTDIGIGDIRLSQASDTESGLFAMGAY